MTTTQARLREGSEELRKQLVAWRRHLHRHPELSFQEYNTADFVEKQLRGFGALEIERLTPTSVVARLIGAYPGKTLALRADMDALPIQEENGHDFVSQAPASCMPAAMTGTRRCCWRRRCCLPPGRISFAAKSALSFSMRRKCRPEALAS